MGKLLNPGSMGFEISRNTRPYVDKSMIIELLNSKVNTENRFVCVSRPRRFGKTMTINMLSAYYDRQSDADALFQGMKITESKSFTRCSNSFNVIKINMQEFVSHAKNAVELIHTLSDYLLKEVLRSYPSLDYIDKGNLSYVLETVSEYTGIQFIIIIDEWDSLFREYKDDRESQRLYLDFLRDFLKDKAYIALCYMTGILPIKKYGTHSALNMFAEFSMENPGEMAEFTGFTEEETEELCREYDIDLTELREWYDGYSFPDCQHIYNPKSIVMAVTTGILDDYWNRTETYEALRAYINLNFDGLRDNILKLIAGDRQMINTRSFQNDMTDFSSCDDVLTLLIHLGYLGYDFNSKEVFIPNKEIMEEFVTATTAREPWEEVVNSIRNSRALLRDTWNGNENAVAQQIESAHLETSHLQYNDENALSYTISLAYYAARDYYTVIRELPAGKGFADLVFVPRKNHMNCPAMIIELKWNSSAETALSQITDRKYPEALGEYTGSILLVGINYDRKTKKHNCKIKKI